MNIAIAGFNLLPLHSVMMSLDRDIIKKRLAVYAAARQARPQRWSGKVRNWQFVDEVHLNPTKNQSVSGANTQEIRMQKAT